MFIVMSLERQTSLSQYNRLPSKMVLERAFITDTKKLLHVHSGTVRKSLHILCLGLPGGIAHEHDRLLWKMVLLRAFIMVTGKPLHVDSGVPGNRAHGVNMIGLHGRWSCKGHSLLTQGSLCTFIQVSKEIEHIRSIPQVQMVL